MNNSDTSPKTAFGQIPVKPDQKALLALLTPPALSYTRELRRSLDKDPNFLAFHEQSIGLKVQTLLSKQGIYWEQEIFEKQFMSLVLEAVVKLRGIEK